MIMSKKALAEMISTIALAVLTVVYVVLYSVLVFANEKYGFSYLTSFIFAGGLVVLIIGLAIFVFLWINETNIQKGSLNENFYNLGKRIEFYNLDTFTKIGIRRKYHKNADRSFIVSYSPIKTNVIYESYQADQVKELYGYLADEFIAYFKNPNLAKIKPSYCFDKNSFLFYFEGEDEILEKIIKDFEEITFRLAKEHDIRLFVQPYFGVYKGNPDVSVFQAIDNAAIARKSGESRFDSVVFFDETKDTTTFENELSAIMNALKNDEFEVYYQPKYHLSHRTFVGMEALVRWNSPVYGMVSPVKFINFAENSGIIHDVDMRVLEKVCQDIAEWKKRGKRILPVSVNFSVYEFYCPTFIDDVVGVIEKYGVNPMLIEAEVTEETTAVNSFFVISILKKLRDIGIKVLLDDFGVAFSNIGNLKKLPIDILKVDKSLIDDIAIDHKAKEIAKAVISMAKAMNLLVIAEGVDNIEQANILAENRCDMIQGYYFAKPLPKKELEKFLSTNAFEKKEVL